MNADKDFYAEGRLKEALSAVRDLPVEDVVRTVKESVREFAGQEPRADDMTMLALRFRGDED